MAKILVVDDAVDILWTVQAVLQAGGHEVVIESDPRAVRARVALEAPELVLLDLMMPGLSGWNLLAELRSHSATRELPVILLSAVDDIASRTRGIREGADDFITKPFDNEELLARVDRRIARYRESLGGLAGDLTAAPLFEVLQSLATNRASGRLVVDALLHTGAIELAHGEIVYAACDALTGPAAVLKLLAARAGAFRFEPTSVPPRVPLGGEPISLAPLLLEAVQTAHGEADAESEPFGLPQDFEADDLDEALDAAARELAQEALFRGFTQSPVAAVVLADEAGWPGLAARLGALAGSLAVPATALMEVLSQCEGTLPVGLGEVAVELRLARVPGASAQVAAFLHDAAAVAIWSGSGVHAEAAWSILAAAPGAANRVHIAAEDLALPAPPIAPDWPAPVSPPASLALLLVALAQGGDV